MLRISVLVLCTLLLAGCRTQQATQRTPDGRGTKLSEEQQQRLAALFIDGATKQAQEYPKEALALYEQVLEIDPQHGAAHYLVAELLYSERQFQAALPHAQAAMKSDKGNVYYHVQLARIQQANNDREASRKTLEAARKQFPQDIDLLIELGQNYLHAKEYRAALGLYDTLLARKGVDPDIIRQKKEIYLYLNEPQQAIAEMLRLVQFYPSVRSYQYELYDLYLQTEQADKARDLLARLYAEDATDAFVLFRMIEAAEQAGDTAQSYELLEKAVGLEEIELDKKVQLLIRADTDVNNQAQQRRIWHLLRSLEAQHPNNSLLASYLGEKYLNLDQQDSARYYIRKAVRLDDTDLNLWKQLISLDIQLRSWDSLQADAARALEVYPNNLDLLFWQAQGSYQNKDYATAAAAAERFVQLAEDQRVQHMLVLMGDALHYLGDYPASNAAYEKALAANPNDATALNNYAYFLSLRGTDLDRAQEMIEQALRIRPDDANFHDTYGWVLYKQGKMEKALEWVKKAYEAAPSADAATHLAAIYEAMGNLHEAKQYRKKAEELGGPKSNPENTNDSLPR
jgi:tetratricopeptide (TPR) repeat protein